MLLPAADRQVLTLPPGAVVLASSPTAPYELWCCSSNVLASQFHLEFDEPLVVDKIWTRLTSIGRLDSEQAAHSKAALEAGGQHNVQMLQVGTGGWWDGALLRAAAPATAWRMLREAHNSWKFAAHTVRYFLDIGRCPFSTCVCVCLCTDVSPVNRLSSTSSGTASSDQQLQV